MKEASFYDKIEGGSVQCHLCNHRCRIADGRRGVCGARENRGGTLYCLVYGKVIAAHVDPIEKKPLFHYMPSTDSFSIATVGCNFSCRHCQNWDISQRTKNGGEIVGREMPPEEVVETAIQNRCSSISYTYTEPTIFMEYAVDTMKIARKRGLGNVFVSNGYTTAQAFDEAGILPDANNVDLKAFTEKFYREICGARLEPVLDTLKYLVKKKVWVEVTTLIIPGYNDSPKELKQIAEFIRGELGDFVPWHISRYHPDYKMNAPGTPIETMRAAYDIGLHAGLKYVYAGNIPHEDSENTHCPNCSELLIERYGFNVARNKLADGKCPACTTKIEGVWQ